MVGVFSYAICTNKNPQSLKFLWGFLNFLFTCGG